MCRDHGAPSSAGGEDGSGKGCVPGNPTRSLLKVVFWPQGPVPRLGRIGVSDRNFSLFIYFLAATLCLSS